MQLHGLAEIADDYGNGKSAVTTRSNIQIREIAPANLVNVLTKLQSLGLTAKGSGVDNIRNVTASPTAGFDPRELLDTRPFAHALHHYILNHREFYNLPRKFNVAFAGGGAVDTVADTNDIGFMACRVTEESAKVGKRESETALGTAAPPFPPRTFPPAFFSVELCITGQQPRRMRHSREAHRAAVCAAMIRVFENGDRTNRKKARLVSRGQVGVEKFSPRRRSAAFCRSSRWSSNAPAAVKHGHIGVTSAQAGKNYIGVVVPVGVSTRQMRRRRPRATWPGVLRSRRQNVLIRRARCLRREAPARPHRPAPRGDEHSVDSSPAPATRAASGPALTPGRRARRHLNKRLSLDHPINIISPAARTLRAALCRRLRLQGEGRTVSSEGYHVARRRHRRGRGHRQAGLHRHPVQRSAVAVERVEGLSAKRNPGNLAFTCRHDVKQLQEMFSNEPAELCSVLPDNAPFTEQRAYSTAFCWPGLPRAAARDGHRQSPIVAAAGRR